MTIHWCGSGLSSLPGLKRLINNGHDIVVWNRTRATAIEAVGDLTKDIRELDKDKIEQATKAGDVIISMLPADWHVPLAKISLSKSAHFVSSSYIAPEMQALDGAAKDANVSLINEVGLDPGIDHLMAHHLVADYRASKSYDVENELSFISYCGGIPKTPNAFRYKFSWSPVGVLKALRSPSRSIDNFKELNVDRPWDAITSYKAPLPETESFEVYPNRDSLPFMQDYKFDDAWRVKKFVRGTLRLNGWKDAWQDVFTEIETLKGDAGEARLKEMSDTFWAENAYAENEPDRVVLCVGLKAENGGKTTYDKTYVMDAWGDERGTAMARMVSVTVSLAVESVLEGKMETGVHPAPSDPQLVADWLKEIARLSQHLEVVG